MPPTASSAGRLSIEEQPRCSLVVPIYKNEGSLDALLDAVDDICAELGEVIEAVFVIDGSPDRCEELLRARLPQRHFVSQLITHSRNFGAFAAIRTGLEHARGSAMAVMAADLQEPPELVVEFFRQLNDDRADVVVGRSTPGRLTRSPTMELTNVDLPAPVDPPTTASRGASIARSRGST